LRQITVFQAGSHYSPAANIKAPAPLSGAGANLYLSLAQNDFI